MGGFPSQMASNAENASIWWRHHGYSEVSVIAINLPQLVCWHLASKIVKSCRRRQNPLSMCHKTAPVIATSSHVFEQR